MTSHICDHAGQRKACAVCPHAKEHQEELCGGGADYCFEAGSGETLLTRCLPVPEPKPETRTIEVPVFRCPDGRPTCGTGEGKTCMFFRVNTDCQGVCMIHLEHVREEGGYPRPCEGCPLWGR
jgi:hypothetical protein